MRAMVVFDLCETVLITIFLAFTIPFTCVVYWKLAFIPPFSENFTFKLIIVDGSTVRLHLGMPQSPFRSQYSLVGPSLSRIIPCFLPTMLLPVHARVLRVHSGEQASYCSW